MNLHNFPKELVNLILEYYGKIKYINGKYYDQLNLEDKKYDLVINTIKTKTFMIQNNLTSNYPGAYLIDIPINQNKYGFMIWHDFNRYMIAFYKNNNDSKYTFIDVYFRFLKFYIDDSPISTYEYK